MLNKNIEKLQFITHDTPSLQHCELIEKACKGGLKWVQLRIKDKPFDEWLQVAEKARHCSREHGATLIINDSVEIAQRVEADGVHLGKNDMSPLEARKILGDNAIIGGTANTFEDIQKAVDAGVDYIGLGPFRFTITKENLSPILTLEGYRKIIDACKKHNITTPLIAIGGIRVEDVREILDTGMYGVAVGTAIGFGDPTNNAQKFLDTLDSCSLEVHNS